MEKLKQEISGNSKRLFILSFTLTCPVTIYESYDTISVHRQEPLDEACSPSVFQQDHQASGHCQLLCSLSYLGFCFSLGWCFSFAQFHPIINSHQHGEERCCSGGPKHFAFTPHVSPSKHIKVCISLRTHSHSLPIKQSYPDPIQVYNLQQITVSYKHSCLQQADT